MAIKNVHISDIGMTGIHPSVVYIDTDSTLAEIQATGFLSKVADQFKLREDMMALVSAKTTPNAQNTQVAWMEISKSGDVWSLVPSETTLQLSDGQIFVGNSSGVATDVAMSGDVAISNTGATTIQALAVETGMLAADAVTNAKLGDDAVSLENLDSGITPSHIVVYAGQPTTAGGAAAEAITVTGAAATDLAFVQMVDDGTNNVTIVNAVVTLNTLTVTFSADPGNDAVINYQIIRAAS